MSGEWELEFRKRVSWALLPEHFRHGFVGSITVADDDGHDPTYETDGVETMSISIDGICPCGRHVSWVCAGPVESADLIRRITDPHISRDMAVDVNPFVEYQTEGEIR